LISLTPNTKYFIRAYAVNNSGIAYGNEISFTTLALTAGTITDIDGNIYHSIIIGTQVWMVENLKTTKYNDGTPIPNVSAGPDFLATTAAAYCWYDNDIKNKADYGALYNWYAVNSGKLCPPGWHVPSNEEWIALANYLGGYRIAGAKLKEAGTIHWGLLSNPEATNESGFTALPGGTTYSGGSIGLGYHGVWWTSSRSDWGPTCYVMSHDNVALMDSGGDNYDGFSVRCIKD
ncbi:MAG TPA: fibrobacter succinogenes major paralogous domain-containing protein, partial [Prolixibacteraceae bacterium]|nr:fibrobacter succinogenes major paralogous domain-containing protein [Prolixibacteraceae bacterium]